MDTRVISLDRCIRRCLVGSRAGSEFGGAAYVVFCYRGGRQSDDS